MLPSRRYLQPYTEALGLYRVDRAHLIVTTAQGSTPVHDLTFDDAGRWLTDIARDWPMSSCWRCNAMVKLFGS